MLDRVVQFLKERSPDQAVQALLASRGACRNMLLPWYERFAGLSEHAVAVRLCYILAAHVHGFDLNVMQGPIDDAELVMKCHLEDRGVLPFIAFDQG